MALVGGLVLRGQDDGVAGEAVAQRVQLRALLAGVSAGAGGFLGVGTVDRSTIGGAVVTIGDD